MRETDDLRIERLGPLIPPAILSEELPAGEAISDFVYGARAAVERILRKQDDRLLVIVGPCSIHDPNAARDYAARLRRLASRLSQELLVVMRVYFEKPRTTVGWKGLINDPRLDGSFAINEGLRTARALLRDLAQMNVPAACEFLDTITPQYLADLVSWGAIGARTAESQVHRELASGLSMPVGFKNGTDGNVQVAVQAAQTAGQPHHFLSVTKQGLSAVVATRGNDSCHVILRGGHAGPNYDRASIVAAARSLRAAGMPERIVVDCSHGNSRKDPERQPEVARDIAGQVAAGDRTIVGLMLESHIIGGRQDCQPRDVLTYGQSITDACLSWETTVPVLEHVAAAVRSRRRSSGPSLVEAGVRVAAELGVDAPGGRTETVR